LSSNQSNGGTTSGGGTYNSGSSVTVTATPNNGYTFTNWTENGIEVSTSSSFTFTISGNRTLVANFGVIPPTQYFVNLSSNPLNGGTTSGGGTYNSGNSVTVTATPNSGYTFINWTENGNVVSTSSSYTYTISGNRILVANFTAIPPAQYSVNLSSNPSNGGTTSGGGTYNSGSSMTVTATPNSGYTFTNWTENGNVVSTSSSYTFTINGNRTLVANFTAIQYSVNLSSNPSNGGTTSGGGTYNSGSSVTVTATPNNGYTFTNWTDNGSISSLNSSYTFILNNDKYLIANFNVTTSVKENELNISQFQLGQNYPNPFNPVTTISYSVPDFLFVVLKVYNSIGLEISELVNGEKNPGLYEVIFDGSKLTSGVYFYRITAGHFTQTKKLLLLK
ncbi:MAG: InlB B-repeat-containing protein, partial [Candidatus Doudnabacteria bacterium]